MTVHTCEDRHQKEQHIHNRTMQITQNRDLSMTKYINTEIMLLENKNTMRTQKKPHQF